MSIRRLNTQQPDFAAKFSELVAVDSSVDPEITRRAEAIVQDVRARGDEAVLEYTNRFDHMDAKSVAEFRLTEEDLKEALETLPKDQKFCGIVANRGHSPTETPNTHSASVSSTNTNSDRAGPLLRKTAPNSVSATSRWIPSAFTFPAVKPLIRLPF